jgi:tight adherence protein B
VRTTCCGRATLAAVAGLAALLLAVPGFAQDVAEIGLRDAQLRADGSTRLIVNLEGLEATQLEPEAFRVLEDGQPIDGLRVEAITDSELDDQAIAAMFLLDTSGSMAGEPIEGIRDAATASARSLTEQGIAVGLVEFSTVPTVLQEPTLDGDALAASIAGIEAGGWTALYDAVIASARLLEGFEGSRTMIVFADGEDNRSEATIEEAVTAANDAAAALTVVVLETERLDLSVLRPLATGTGGRLVSVTEAEELEAVFEQVTQGITNQYVIRYDSDILEPTELPVSVIVQTPDDGELRVDSTVLNVRTEAAQELRPPPPSDLTGPRIAFLGTTAGLWIGLLAGFLAILVLLWALLVSSQRTEGARSLEQGLRAIGRGGKRSDDELTLPTSKFTERAIDLVGRVPKPKGFDERLQAQLDQAAWLIRSNEFLVMCIAGGLLGALFLGAATQTVLGAFPGGLLGAMVPVLVMKIRISRRRAAFVEQLPSTLQLLAGSLRAGYGLLQALDAVVKEASEPTSQEFARVLTEVRLGMPLDESLEGMAQRLDSEDFHWVVLAIGIQREVGGNLAELLTTVGRTMRDRATLRRQIRVLSAEGRISAWVVAAMPFVVAFALVLLDPGYLSELFTRIEGIVMLVMAAVLLAVGGLWLRKIVDIEV